VTLDLLAAVLIGVILLPSSVGAAAGRVGLNCHPVVYFIGPALYHYGHDLAPGVDYYSQYGVAPGYVFSFLLREQAEATVENYVWLCVALCALFYFTLYLVLRRPLGRLWSLGVVLFTLILLFATNAAFLCPSSWVLRFPLLPTFVGLLAHPVRRPNDLRAVVWVGVCVGLSIFWNTETGLSMLCAGGLVLLVHDVSHVRRLRGPAVFTATALLTVLAVSSLAWGEKAWSPAFVEGMLRPLWIYGGGFGAIPLEWDFGWNRVYAVAFPLLGTATVGWGLAELASGERARRAAAALPLLFALLGLCFLVKWVNRSYQIVWMQNAVPLLVVAGWWLHRACRAVDGPWAPRRWLATGLAGACAVLAVAYLCAVKDPRFDQPIAARAFWEHPSVARALVTRDRADGWPAELGSVSAEDIALILRLTRPDEQVALISQDDWVYLLAAKRAPKLEIIPGALLFLNREVDRSFAGVERLFVERDANGSPRLPPDWEWTFPVWTYASPLIARDFDLEAVGDRLAVYRRRPR
jgi:hypothetical protein